MHTWLLCLCYAYQTIRGHDIDPLLLAWGSMLTRVQIVCLFDLVRFPTALRGQLACRTRGRRGLGRSFVLCGRWVSEG
eukprot:1366755-Rhodomonas_salina.1